MNKKTTSTPHDAAFKEFMTQIENAKDFFDIHLPEKIKQLCDLSTLALTNSSFIDRQLRSKMSDVLYSVKTQRGDGYIYVLVEHQSTPDKMMAWRMMHYSFMAMNQHLQQGNKALPLVVPVLFYHGNRSPYPFQQTWTQCFSLPELAEEIYFNPFPLVDVTVIDDNELVNHRKIAVMELAMKHKNLREEFKAVTTLLAQVLKHNYNSDNDVVTILNYLFNTMDSPYFVQVLQLLIEQADSHQEAIMSIAERLQEKGRKEGLQQGIQQGMQQGIQRGEEKGQREARLKIARSLLKNGASIELIMESTGLSREELLSLQ
ncbi:MULTISPECIES: Rpn family recombination-promoting nuclease/putative transposase [Xenorhabdus]|uniref:Putative transposase n=1 Tax=Xenorhabdus ehlersii TaxID=290111 RepID=A0A2D0IPU1_9GAMM|nr:MULTISPECIES: Rpn family recombination-promoting nuclease/putative transposase [Xenorhabdus]MBC8949313.1 putative transposase [Xenorhabdus sp. TS4]PHM23778.1 putative transposase [Xenorhabdus ehlersii]RKE89256.1 putative transposase/invertase (TIGR01784 family) [Xenorhabdus ehlersii]